jgi:hypothetical protein
MMITDTDTMGGTKRAENGAHSVPMGPSLALGDAAFYRDCKQPHNAGVVGSSPTPAIAAQRLTPLPGSRAVGAAPWAAPSPLKFAEFLGRARDVAARVFAVAAEPGNWS